MPYLHKAKWGALESLSKRTFVIDPHMYSAAVGTIRTAEANISGGNPAIFWRTKTRCSSYAEWMELHDASDGAVLWRAEVTGQLFRASSAGAISYGPSLVESNVPEFSVC